MCHLWVQLNCSLPLFVILDLKLMWLQSLKKRRRQANHRLVLGTKGLPRRPKNMPYQQARLLQNLHPSHGLQTHLPNLRYVVAILQNFSVNCVLLAFLRMVCEKHLLQKINDDNYVNRIRSLFYNYVLNSYLKKRLSNPALLLQGPIFFQFKSFSLKTLQVNARYQLENPHVCTISYIILFK